MFILKSAYKKLTREKIYVFVGMYILPIPRLNTDGLVSAVNLGTEKKIPLHDKNNYCWSPIYFY